MEDAGKQVALASLAMATEEIRSVRGATILRLWCIPGLATRWLMPRLAAIKQILPGTEIVLRSTDAVPDFTRDEADVFLGFGDLANLPQDARHLLRPRMFPIAGREWLHRHGAPTSLAELADCPLIHEESYRQWMAWFEAAGLTLQRPLHGQRLWDASLAMDAARAGKWIVLANRLLAEEEMARGELVELLHSHIHLGGYYILPAPQVRATAMTPRLTAWLLAELRSAEGSATPPRVSRPAGGSRISY